MKKIKWRFEGIETYIISTEVNFPRDIVNFAKRNNLTLDHKIIIENEYFDTADTSDSPCRHCNSSTATQPTLPVDAKKTKRKQATTELRNVSGNVDNVDTATNILEDGPDLELLNGTIDSVVE